MKNAVIDKKGMLDNDVEVLINKANIIIESTIKKINYELTNMYWKLGQMVVDFKKDNNSKYTDAVISMFSNELSLKYGKGFSIANISFAVKFYNIFSEFSPAKNYKNVSWSHYREVLTLSDFKRINYYLTETNNKKLTKLETREIIKSKSYERIIANQNNGEIKNNIEKTLKDPVILKIENKKRTEKELEDEIMINIFKFMNEIGNNITLFGRQYKIVNHGLIYRVDLVLYDKENRNFI